MADISDDQKDVIRKIIKISEEMGLDPHLALATAFNESTFQNIPAADKKSTAFGPFQVNKATAEANGVDYEDMKKNPDLAIRTGVANLVRHAKNPALEGDPARILAAHRWGESSPYASSGDISTIPEGGAAYLHSVGSMLPGGDFPKTIYGTPKERSPEETKSAEAEGDQKPLLGGTPLPLQALASGAAGAALAGQAAAPIYGVYRGGQAALEFGKSLMERMAARENPDLSTRVDPTLTGTATDTDGQGKGSGPKRYLGGRTTELTAVPEALVNTVATYKGEGPGTAAGVEAENAANIKRQIGVGAPLETWKPEPGGRILLDTAPSGGGGSRTYDMPSIQDQARGITTPVPKIGGKPAISRAPLVVPTPEGVPTPAAEAKPSGWSKAWGYTKDALRSPVAKAATIGGGFGASLPYAAVEWQRGNPRSALEKIALGTGAGAAAAFSPVARKVLPPLGAIAEGYDASKRAQAKDYTGAALSAAGGVGALAMLAKGVNPWVASGVAIGAPLANLARDWLKENPGAVEQWAAEREKPPEGKIMGNITGY